MRDVVIVSAVRTPVGKFLGALSELSAVELGALAVREAVRRAGIAPETVDECVMGCVLPAGLGQNPARQAALRGGLADTVSALTINMVCGSGLKAVGACGAGGDDGNCGSCGGRGHGVDEQCALPFAAGAQRAARRRWGSG